MTLASAIQALEAISVTGFTFLDLDEQVAPIYMGDLPARVIVFAGVGGIGFNPDDFAQGGVMVVSMLEYLMVRGAGMGANPATRSELAGHMDNYLAGIKTDVLLSGNLNKPLTVIAESFAPFTFGTSLFQGITLRHMWELKI